MHNRTGRTLTTPREQYERLENSWLAPAGAHSALAERVRAEVPCAIRTAFQRDRDRVVHCQAFRRLKSKTQVFLPPSGDHVRTRLTHTLEVTQIARTIARALQLNEDLTEAIALAHDLGHTPFGHAGEAALASVYPGFRHNEQSLRVVDMLERDGQGLNLTTQVRDGILRHSKPENEIAGSVAGQPSSAEGQIVKISDGIAYISHDLEDALNAGMLDNRAVPAKVISVLGDRHSARINQLVTSVIEHSRPHLREAVGDRQVIIMGREEHSAADELRNYLFSSVYAPINLLPSTRHAKEIVVRLYSYFVAHPSEMPAYWHKRSEHDGADRTAADFVSGMTDDFARRTYHEVFIPRFEEI